jgi:hypothetical protein
MTNKIKHFPKWFQNLPSDSITKGGQVSVLDWAGQSSKYSRYSCGWPPQSALTSNPIEGFETTSPP